MKNFNKNYLAKCIYTLFFLVVATPIFASELLVGTSTVDITPPLPVSLDGQMRLRVAEEVETPLTASVVALENIKGTESQTSIWVAMELVVITDKLKEMILDAVKQKIPGIDSEKIIINATHTHTGPTTREGNFILPNGITTIDETLNFLTEKVVLAISQAWDSREPGSVSWGIGQSKLATNRRAVYYDGSSRMYGKTDLPEFRGLEGVEDHDVNLLFFWDATDKLLATVINVACPAQEVEGRSSINADFWHPVRETLREKLGEELVVLGWIGAAGDQSPHLMFGNQAEDRMLKLRNLDRLEELARRIVTTVLDVYQVIENDRYKDVELIHEVKRVKLPKRWVTLEAVNEAKRTISDLEKLDEETKLRQYRLLKWHGALLERYEKQSQNPDETYDVDIHLVKLGDVVICTNPFELFTEYGIRIKARSKALQTFVVQLVGGGTYLPTMEAVRGGHYSAIIQSTEVGPEGGDILVEETVRGIHQLWEN
ncbi:neutral/alkaline non-lysosomal ceramidase N-terminal domain-containing protein [Lunatibacter salilacus]|uniref:neutral/alkaline non-lysosomal ceramidase N-terminal domain-containing protein n=1 Tax=Lunatibacter salilacus TaxID=2483804 RepID=UPI00131CF443|nr:neutral/alkaline non-lysosomal ceramidase N-terminal domain-containing protein [Lunatibacter salilacus]